MKVSRLRVLMQRYKYAGVLLVACYLGIHHLWSKHRSLLLLLPFTLLGGIFLCRAIPLSRPVQHKITPAIPPAQSKVNVPETPEKISIDAKPDYSTGSDVPYRAHWGVYTIVVEQDGTDETGRPQRLRILDTQGNILREIRGWAITCVELEKMTGYSPEELHITVWEGGNHACISELYFSQKGGLHIILVFEKHEENGWEVTDLNQDGIPEIIAENSVLGDFDNGVDSFHKPRSVITILGWNGIRYVDVTKRYPSRSLEEAVKHRTGILEVQQLPAEEQREWARQDFIAAYYANMLNIGQGRTARRWLKEHVSTSDWNWVREHDTELRQIMATAAERRAHVSQEKVIEP